MLWASLSPLQTLTKTWNGVKWEEGNLCSGAGAVWKVSHFPGCVTASQSQHRAVEATCSPAVLWVRGRPARVRAPDLTPAQGPLECLGHVLALSTCFWKKTWPSGHQCHFHCESNAGVRAFTHCERVLRQWGCSLKNKVALITTVVKTYTPTFTRVVDYSIELAFVDYFSFLLLLLLLLDYTSGRNIVLLTPLHLSESCNHYYLKLRIYTIKKNKGLKMQCKKTMSPLLHISKSDNI